MENRKDEYITTIDEMADAFLKISPMTHKKLQKLCYYSYSWYLTYFNKSLFPSKFEAWIHGPVEPSLYRRFKEKGWIEINDSEIMTQDIKVEVTQWAQNIYNSYGHLDGNQLEYLTHAEAPWLKARGGIAEYESSNSFIEDDVIRNFYLGVLENEQQD